MEQLLFTGGAGLLRSPVNRAEQSGAALCALGQAVVLRRKYCQHFL